ncbi:hypothetical protein CR513_54502, partial [Mucuna pruriens]
MRPECQAILAQVISAQARNIPASPALLVKPTSATSSSVEFSAESRASAVSNRKHSKLVQWYTKLQYGVSLGRGGTRPGFGKLVAFKGNTHHFDNRGSTTSRGRNEIVATDNQRFEGYIDGCGMCVSTKYNCHNARVDNTNWSTGHHDKSVVVRRFWTSSFPSHSQSTREYK